MPKITNPVQLKQEMQARILRPLLEYLTKTAISVLKQELNKADISTSTLQDYISYQINDSGTKSEIYIAFQEMQDREAHPPTFERGRLIEWGRFTSLNGDTSYGGQPITWQMMNWIENGASGSGKYIGNQPIEATHVFEKTDEILRQNIPQWTRQFLNQFNYR